MQLPALNIVDGVILLIMGLSMARGFLNGGSREIVGILIWVSAIVIAFVFTPSVRPMMPEIGLFGDFADACLIATFLAFISLFVLSILAVSVLSPIISRATSRGEIGAGDQLIGLGFGLIRGAIIVLIAYIAYNAVIEDADKPDLLTSAAFADLLESGAALFRSTDTEGIQTWIGSRLEALTEGCGYIDRTLPDVEMPAAPVGDEQ